MENKNKINIEIAEVKVEIKNLKDKLDKFIDNDFSHLRDRIDEINNKLLWGFIVGIVSLIITQIILKFFEH